MSLATAGPDLGIERPRTLMAAVGLTVFMAAISIATVGMTPDDAPGFVIPLVVGLSLVWMATGVWLWMTDSKWAAMAVFAISFMSALAAIPAFFESELSTAFRITNVFFFIEAVAVCWLLVMRSTRDALR